MLFRFIVWDTGDSNDPVTVENIGIVAGKMTGGRLDTVTVTNCNIVPSGLPAGSTVSNASVVAGSLDAGVSNVTISQNNTAFPETMTTSNIGDMDSIPGITDQGGEYSGGGSGGGGGSSW